MASSQTGAERQAAFITGLFGGGGPLGIGQGQQTGITAGAAKKKKKEEKLDPNDPFAARKARVQGMPKGAEKNAARRDLHADIKARNQKAQEQKNNAFNPADWGDNDAYNPFNAAPNFDYGSFGFDDEHNYGNEANNFLQTEIGKNMIKQNPDAYYAYAQATAGNPIDQTTAYGRYLGDQFGVLYDRYNTAQLVSPNLTWDKYLAGILPQQEALYRTLPYQQRGDTPMVGGGATWIGGW